MFAANGLLGSTPSNKILPDQTEQTNFVPTGLLAGPEADLDDIQTDDIINELSGEPVSFISTGLLSAKSTSPFPPSSRATTPLSLRDEDGIDEDEFDDDLQVPTAHATSFTPTYVPRISIKAKTFDGNTVFLNQRVKTSTMKNGLAASSATKQYNNLLDVPIHRLMDQLSVTAAATLQRDGQASPSTSSCGDVLWVDRYRPRKFTELVGNEKVARDALSWIKEWDYCVFGKSKGKKRQRDADEVTTQDKYRRPRERVLLLSGAPGLGKTTLAHVLARHAGYEVMEINASDARSGTIIDDRIRPTLEAGSAVGSTKPVLLVIDEIDGATGAGDNSGTFVAKLVQLVQARPSKKRGKDHGPRAILRPIICICNDFNASSLTKLRPHAYSIRFYRPADIHLVNRLKEVCQIEGLNAESRALSTLVSSAKGDLRGCLNALQFINRQSNHVTEPIVRKATIGMKEADTNYITVLNNLFTPLAKKRVKELGLTDEEEMKYVARLCHDIDGTGRESNIASGCFGHYVTQHQHDSTLSRHLQAANWLTTFDTFSSAMYSDGDFTLSHYLPYTLVSFYHFFNQRGGGKVERNQADWEHFQTTKSNEEILNSLGGCLRSATIRYGGDFRHLLSHPILQLEFVPYINRIISPPLRPVNSQIIRPQEKALMARLVDVMASLELRFVQEKGDDGQVSYRLDPPVDVFVTYDGKRATDIMASRYAVRHLVAAEIETKLIARDTEYSEKGRSGKKNIFNSKSFMRKDQIDIENPDNSSQPNKRLKLAVQDIADKPPTDFFGRLITVAVGSESNLRPADVPKPFKVSYKFLEGNSAAVRKPVKVNWFL